MPDLGRLLKGFKLSSGNVYANKFTLNSTHGQEQTITKNKQYKYYVDLKFTGPTDLNSQNQLLDVLQEQLFEPMDILSAYHNPYECKFISLDVTNIGNNSITIHAIADSHRV